MVAMNGNNGQAAGFDLTTVGGQMEACWQQYYAARESTLATDAATAELEAQLETDAYRSARAAARRQQPPHTFQLWRVLQRICNGPVANINSTGEWALN